MKKPKPQKKKRNAQDITLRNNRARKNEIDELRQRVTNLEDWVLRFLINSAGFVPNFKGAA